MTARPRREAPPGAASLVLEAVAEDPNHLRPPRP
jgi:hypothetical protein